MKSRFALLAMLVVAAAPLAAQGGGGMRQGGGRGGMSLDQYVTTYKLTDSQKAKFEPVLKAYTDHQASLRTYSQSQAAAGAEQSPDSVKLRADLTAKFNADFKAILTADQAKVFDSVQAARAAMGGRRGGGGGGK